MSNTNLIESLAQVELEETFVDSIVEEQNHINEIVRQEEEIERAIQGLEEQL